MDVLEGAATAAARTTRHTEVGVNAVRSPGLEFLTSAKKDHHLRSDFDVFDRSIGELILSGVMEAVEGGDDAGVDKVFISGREGGLTGKSEGGVNVHLHGHHVISALGGHLVLCGLLSHTDVAITNASEGVRSGEAAAEGILPIGVDVVEHRLPAALERLEGATAAAAALAPGHLEVGGNAVCSPGLERARRLRTKEVDHHLGSDFDVFDGSFGELILSGVVETVEGGDDAGVDEVLVGVGEGRRTGKGEGGVDVHLHGDHVLGLGIVDT